MVHPFLGIRSRPSDSLPVTSERRDSGGRQQDQEEGQKQTSKQLLSNQEDKKSGTGYKLFSSSGRCIELVAMGNLPFFQKRVWSEKGSWFTGDRLDIHVAIETHNMTDLRKCLKSGLCDPSINCCKLYVFQSPHLIPLRGILPNELENVAPLHLAVIVDNHDAVRMLLRPCNQMRTPVSVNQRIKTCHSTALHLAVLLRRRNMISDLVGSGADVVTLKDSMGFTAFELAVHLDPSLAAILYQQYYACRTYKRSFLYEYLSVMVDVKAASMILDLGDNVGFEDEGESVFQRFLRTYDKKNMLEVARFLLSHVDLAAEEKRMRDNRLGVTRRTFPSLFQPGPVYGRVRKALPCRKRYNSLAIVIMFCKRSCKERIGLMQMLYEAGSLVSHTVKNERSLLHLCAKSRYSNVQEAEFLIEKGVPIKWTDVREAIKRSRYDLLDLFFSRSEVRQLRLQFHLKHAMSMLAMKSSPESILKYSANFFVSESHVLVRYFDQMIQHHGLDPASDGGFYPLPLLHILLLKNKIHGGLYIEAIRFIANHSKTDLHCMTMFHGAPITYARSLKQFVAMNILIEADEMKYESMHRMRDKRSASLPLCSPSESAEPLTASLVESPEAAKCSLHCCRHEKHKRVSFSETTKFELGDRDNREALVEEEEELCEVFVDEEPIAAEAANQVIGAVSVIGSPNHVVVNFERLVT